MIFCASSAVTAASIRCLIFIISSSGIISKNTAGFAVFICNIKQNELIVIFILPCFTMAVCFYVAVFTLLFCYSRLMHNRGNYSKGQGHRARGIDCLAPGIACAGTIIAQATRPAQGGRLKKSRIWYDKIKKLRIIKIA